MGRQVRETAIITGMSKFLTEGGIIQPSGFTAQEKPNTAKMLKMLLPITLPTAISTFPLNVAITEVTNSGSEVPMATTVKPIISSLTFRFLAIRIRLSTNKPEP